ncbi:MAG: histidine phosphatase family protein [Microthrixaceae bacterium]
MSGSPPVDVLLVRHGRTTHNAMARLSGREDVALDDTGEQQATALGQALATELGAPGEAPTPVIVSSPLRRCVRTAQIIAGECGLPAEVIVIEDRFVEMDYGTWDGRPLSEVPANTWAHWRTDPNHAFPGGESLVEVTERVRAGLIDWVARSDGSRLVIASHVSPIKAAVICALRVDESVTWRMRLSNASITRLTCTLTPEGDLDATLIGFNDVAHLASP